MSFIGKTLNKNTHVLLILALINISLSLSAQNLTGSFTFNNNNQCSGTSISFTSSVYNGTPPYTYHWDFGDGTSFDQNPTHTFNAEGCGTTNFVVNLDISDSNSQKVTIIDTVTVKQKPIVSLEDQDYAYPFNNCDNSPTTSNPDYTITIDNTSDSCISSFDLDWGDGTSTINGFTASDFPLTHTYTSLGEFTITFSGSGINGCNNTTTYSVANLSNPAGGLGTSGSTKSCAPLTVPFVISNWTSNSVGTSYILDYGDGIRDTFSHPLSTSTYNHIYTTSNCDSGNSEYIAKLIVSNACISTEYTASGIEVWTSPQAGFYGPDCYCVNQPVTFIDTTTEGHYGHSCYDGSTYIWDFGDGTIDTIKNVNPTQNTNHIYTDTGTYIITLTTSNDCGTSTALNTIRIQPTPDPVFVLDTAKGCGPLVVTASNLTDSVGMCSGFSYEWYISYSSSSCGNGANYSILNGNNTIKNPIFRFENSGVYSISLWIISDCGTIKSKTQDVVVKGDPSFTLDTIAYQCLETDIDILPNITVNDGCSDSTLDYNWTFPTGIPSSSKAKNPGYIKYTTSGTKTMYLTIYNECGYAYDSTSFVIDSMPTVDSIYNQTICNGYYSDPVIFSGKVNNTIYNWTNTDTTIGIPSSGTGNIGSYLMTNTGATSRKAIITVTPQNNNCSGTSRTFTITVKPSYHTSDTIEICDNQLPYKFQNDTIFPLGTTSGIYVFKKPSANGCDSVTVLNLTVYQTHLYDTLAICSDELPYIYRDTTFDINTISNDFIFYRHNTFGCDSIVHLNLNVCYSNDSIDTLSICPSELPYTYNDTVFGLGTSSGDYIFRRKNHCGCDSALYLHLEIMPLSYVYDTLTYCQNELPVMYGDILLSSNLTSGDYPITRTNKYGCDSLIFLHITINKSYNISDTINLCDDQLPYTYYDTTFNVGTTSGTHLLKRYTSSNCDSIIILKLNIYQTHLDEYLSLCTTDLPYTFRDTTFGIGTVSDTYIFNRQNKYGCDSIVSLHLSVCSNNVNYDTVSVCDGTFPLHYRDTTFYIGTASGNYTFHRQNSCGCDSITYLNINILPAYYEYDTLVMCENNLPYHYGDVLLGTGTTSGDYTLKKANAYGCDSLTFLNLTIYPSYSLNDKHSICKNELPYTYYDTTFQTNTTSGVYYFHHYTSHGCDSIITLNLIVNDTYVLFDTLVICESDLPYLYGDTVFETNTHTGDFKLHRYSVTGCDSITNLYLEINQSYNINDDLTLCQNELPYLYADQILDKDVESGNYVFFTQENGCFDTINLSLTILPSYNENDTLKIYKTDLPYAYADTVFKTNTEEGDYTIRLNTIMGCDSIVTLSLSFNTGFEITIDSVVEGCSDDERMYIDFDINKGIISYYSVYFDTVALSNGFSNIEDRMIHSPISITIPDNVYSNIYNAEILFKNSLFSKKYDVEFIVDYPSSVIVQLWNDVLALLNKNNNGGYSFTDYQWYKDGKAIDNANESYLYLSDGSTLDTTSEYTVKITRNDNVVLFTCPFIPTHKTDISIYPTVVEQDKTITIETSTKGKATLWDISGKKVMDMNLSEGKNLLSLSCIAGQYILVVNTKNSINKNQLITIK